MFDGSILTLIIFGESNQILLKSRVRLQVLLPTSIVVDAAVIILFLVDGTLIQSESVLFTLEHRWLVV